MVPIRPDWVMVGFPARTDLVPCQPGQVAILASTKLSQAQLEYTARCYDFTDWEQFRSQFKPHYTLAVELDDFVVVVADTYLEALAELLRTWRPDTAEPITSATPNRFLTAGPAAGSDG